MLHSFFETSLEPFLTIPEWVQWRDGSKSIRAVCISVQTRRDKEDGIMLRKWMDVFLWPNRGPPYHRSSHTTPYVRVEFPELEDVYCNVVTMRWNRDMPEKSLRGPHQYEPKIEFLELGSYYGFASNCHDIGRPSRNCLVKIGESVFDANIEIKMDPNSLYFRAITIQPRMLRMSLGQHLTQCVGRIH